MIDKLGPRNVAFGDRERDTSSYQRATTEATTINRHSAWLFTVELADADDDHTLCLYRDGRAWVGGCDCKGFQFHEGPCAHLWAVKHSVERGTFSLANAAEILGQPPTCPTCGETPDQVEDDHAEA